MCLLLDGPMLRRSKGEKDGKREVVERATELLGAPERKHSTFLF